jgi:predicted sugar kinase
MKQQQLFPNQATVVEVPKPLSEKQIEDTLFDRVLAVAKGNLMSVQSAVRLVLRKAYYEFDISDKGRWVYLANKLSKRAKRAIRGALKKNTRVRA